MDSYKCPGNIKVCAKADSLLDSSEELKIMPVFYLETLLE